MTTNSPRHWTRKVAANSSTSELNDILNDPDRRGWECERLLLDACLAEKDRRLADPNSPDFRPQFN
jgi:hypothetical protein